MSAQTDIYTKQAAVLASKLGLPGEVAVTNTIAGLLRSGYTNKTKRDVSLRELIQENPKLHDTVKLISDDLQTVETLLRTVIAPDTPNDDVTFYNRLVNDPLYQFDYIDQFMRGSVGNGTIGDLGWTGANAGGAGTVNNTVAVSKHPGIYTITSAAAAGGVQSITLGGAAADKYVVASDCKRCISILRLGATITTMKARVGLMNSSVATGAAITDGIYFEFGTADAFWHGVCRAASVETRISGKTAVASQWEKLEFYILDDGSVDFYIGDVLIGNISTNVPLATAHAIAFAVEATAAAARAIDADYFRITGSLMAYSDQFTSP